MWNSEAFKNLNGKFIYRKCDILSSLAEIIFKYV